MLMLAFLAFWAGSWHWIAFFILCILKRVLYCQGQSWASWVMQRTALQYWVCTQKKNPINHVITNLKLEIINTESIPLHQFSNDPLFSSWIKTVIVLCVATAWFLISALRESGKLGGFYTHVGGCDSVVVVHISNQAVQTDNGKLHVTIYQFNSHCF